GDVSLTTRNSNHEVEHAPDGLCRNAWPVVGDRDPGSVGGDNDAGRDVGLFTGVDRIVDKFLQDDERPLRRAMPGLRDELFLARKVEQARRTERLSLKTRLSLALLQRGSMRFSFRADPPPKQIITSAVLGATAPDGRRFSAAHSRARPRFLPAAIIADSDADAPLGELRHDGAVAAANNAAAGALADPVEFAPLGEGQNSVAFE